jgi:6-phosphogluconolactonase (cycloisomerase 2 family)
MSSVKAAATNVAQGSSVNLTVSSGPTAAQVAVPNVVGMTQEAATAAVTAAGLVLGGFGSEPDATVAAGNVIYVSPAAGTEVAAGSDVTLTISSGGPPVPVAVPNVVGLTQAAATASIVSAALVLGNTTTISSSTVASGSIISQSPAAATTVQSGSTVNVTVSGAAGGDFAYVANGDGTISAYSRSLTTGALTPLNPATITVVASPPHPSVLNAIVIDPSGRSLYVLGYYNPNGTVTGGIYTYAINSNNGSLAPVPGSPFILNGTPWSIVFDATGAYAYVTDLGGSVTAYSRDPNTGALASLTQVPYYLGMAGVAAQPNDMIRVADHIYTADAFADSIQLFTIVAGSGLLDTGIGSPYATGGNPNSLLANQSGSVLFANSAISATSPINNVLAFNTSSYTGELTPFTSNPLLTTTSFLEALDPSNQFLLFIQPLGVEVYPINTTTGVIGTMVSGSPFATSPNQSTASPSQVSFDSTGKFVYVINQGSVSLSGGAGSTGGIAIFTFDIATGAISTVVGSPVTAGANPVAIAIK